MNIMPVVIALRLGFRSSSMERDRQFFFGIGVEHFLMSNINEITLQYLPWLWTWTDWRWWSYSYTWIVNISHNKNKSYKTTAKPKKRIKTSEVLRPRFMISVSTWNSKPYITGDSSSIAFPVFCWTGS